MGTLSRIEVFRVSKSLIIKIRYPNTVTRGSRFLSLNLMKRITDEFEKRFSFIYASSDEHYDCFIFPIAIKIYATLTIYQVRLYHFSAQDQEDYLTVLRC